MSNEVARAFDALVERCERACRKPEDARKIRIQVGSATCEHAAGSLEVLDEFRKHVKASGRDDIILRQTGCTGRCSREPIVGVFVPDQMPVKYERVDRDLVHAIFTSHVQNGVPLLDRVLDGPVTKVYQYEVLFCVNTRCCPGTKTNWPALFAGRLRAAGVDPEEVRIGALSCLGACGQPITGDATHVLVRPSHVLYRVAGQDDLDEIIRAHLIGGTPVERLRVRDDLLSARFFDIYGDVAFFTRQTRIALRNCGVVNPESLEEYVHYQGFAALAKVLTRGNPAWVIDEITRSKLRGRGGGGFPTGAKWAHAVKSPEKTCYIICNADEGDPGAFMDRSMLESDPFSVVEGMIIGGYAVGAKRGFFYIRAEYPLAVMRVQHAIEAGRAFGLLGRNVLESGFDFDLEIRLGAGAFVCGEETALIHSIEGERGQPRIRPPFPTERGLWGKPTVINNVETFANVPVILNYGAEWFSRLGSEASGGTKVFALAGQIKHTGLVEVPMGTTLREVVFDIGGGAAGGKQVKAVQTGGPAGGCIPLKWIDTVVDFDTLTQAGSIMGSGGMIVLDEDACMVDIAKFFIAFSQDESCGKCTPCREGTLRLLEILERITSGKGVIEDLDKLERLAKVVKRSSLCGLGRAAPNPVLSTMTHFRDEYLAHVVEKRCPARRCVALIHYEIDPETCTGCTLCARRCPVPCIAGERRKPHVIDQARCIKCGACFEACKFGAVLRK
jgi:NADH:ubiquinone oxidoreductase subunit F (NADH-binding)/(2Fe-2S) ferredoxin